MDKSSFTLICDGCGKSVKLHDLFLNREKDGIVVEGGENFDRSFGVGMKCECDNNINFDV